MTFCRLLRRNHHCGLPAGVHLTDIARGRRFFKLIFSRMRKVESMEQHLALLIVTEDIKHTKCFRAAQ